VTLRLVDSAWSTELTDAARADTSALRIVCPFIKTGALDRLLALRPRKIEVITRFNLADFVDCVSDLDALRKLLAAGGQVRGIKNLHAKLYLFGVSRAVVTSANLTGAALDRNAEFGAVLGGAADIGACRAYFDQLWSRAGNDLTLAQLVGWQADIARHRKAGGWSSGGLKLADHGADAGLGNNTGTSPPPTPAGASAPAAQAFVKLLGIGSDREALSCTTMTEIERAGCHRTLSYPKGKRPTGVTDGALMFVGRLTRDAGVNDIRIFGRAWACAHEPGTDDASALDIARRDWRATWPHYVRVHGAEFMAAAMGDGVSLNELMAAWGADAFLPTQRNRAFNLEHHPQLRRNENPRTAYRQQPAVELSQQGQAWLAQRLQAAIAQYGLVPQSELDAIA
jgi:PLD-like domain